MEVSVGASAVVLDGSGVLLIKPEDFEIWRLPGGQIDAGESAAAAAVREVREGTGHQIELSGLIGIYSDVGGWADTHSVVFADVAVGEPGEVATPHEVLHVGWFPVDELPCPMQRTTRHPWNAG